MSRKYHLIVVTYRKIWYNSPIVNAYGPVAQWIEHLPPEQGFAPVRLWPGSPLKVYLIAYMRFVPTKLLITPYCPLLIKSPPNVIALRLTSLCRHTTLGGFYLDICHFCGVVTPIPLCVVFTRYHDCVVYSLIV